MRPDSCCVSDERVISKHAQRLRVRHVCFPHELLFPANKPQAMEPNRRRKSASRLKQPVVKLGKQSSTVTAMLALAVMSRVGMPVACRFVRGAYCLYSLGSPWRACFAERATQMGQGTTTVQYKLRLSGSSWNKEKICFPPPSHPFWFGERILRCFSIAHKHGDVRKTDYH